MNKSGATILSASMAMILLAQPHPALAAREYDVVQHLDFGTFSVARNNAIVSVTVAPNGDTSYDPGVYPNIEAKPGEYELTDFPPNMTITLGTFVANPPTDGGLKIDNSTGLTSGGSPPFTVSNFTCNNPTTDASGNATLLIGATLTTTGLGGYYESGNYLGSIDLTFYLD